MPPAGQGEAAPGGEERTVIESLLRQRANALRSDDADLWLATVDPREPSLRDAERARFQGMAALPLTAVTFELEPAGGLGSGAGGTVADADGTVADADGTVAVRTSYTLGGSVRADHVDVVAVTRIGEGWLLGASHPAVAVEAGGTVPPWYLPGVQSYPLPGGGTLLTWPVTNGQDGVSHGPGGEPVGQEPVGQEPVGQEPELAEYLASGVDAAEAAVPGSGDGDAWALVAAPASAADYRSLVPGTGEAGSAFAAVTATVPGPGRGGSIVVLNPGRWPALDAGERRVVLTHELVHARVATTLGGGQPLWLAEGFADQVALRPVLESGVTRAQLASAGATVLDPATAELPSAADFADPDSGAYTVAWLAVDYIARAYGERAVLDLVTALARPIGVSAGSEEVDAALVSVLGVDRPTLLSMWRSDLQATVVPPA